MICINNKDYSYIKIGYCFPVSNIKCLSNEYSRRDKPTLNNSLGRLRHYVKCECPICHNEFEGRLDRLEFNPKTQEAPRTLCCKPCSFIHKRNLKDPWRSSINNHAEKNTINIDRSKKLEGVQGNLLILPPNFGKTDKFGNAWWLCQCSCGNKEFIRQDILTGTNHKDSHPKLACSKCLRSISLGEQAIEKYLKENNINYERQIQFETLRGVNGGMLKFDFGIKDNKNQYKFLIEFQGLQHYKPIDFFGGEEQFKIQKEHDNRKYIWCKNNNITLIEIPYNYVNIENYLNQLKN